MRPQRRLETQRGQVLRDTVVNLVGDAKALTSDGFRLAPALSFGRNVFNCDDYMAVVRRIGRSDDAHGKARAIPTLVCGLGGHRAALLDLLNDGQAGRSGLFGHQVGGRHSHQLGGRVAVNQLRPPVDLQDGRGNHGQVGNEDADGHVLEQVAVTLFAGPARTVRLAGHRNDALLPQGASGIGAYCTRGRLICATQPVTCRQFSIQGRNQSSAYLTKAPNRAVG